VFVATNQGGKYVAQQRPITVGDTVGNDYAVLSGLQNGDKVIVSGIQFLMDGAPVQPLG
jgi:multidrug efflux pump subunit AcrA (membrane-fusion protein)